MIVSFSGGQTSGFMSKLIKDGYLSEYYPDHDPVFIFANTGLENNETLDFVDRCDKAYGLNVVWIESVTNPVHGKGVTHRVTSYEKAFRNDQYKHPEHPFHAHIRKNGIPNMNKPQCSDRLKEYAIEHYKKENGLKGYPHCIGIRADEKQRVMPAKVRKVLEKINVNPNYIRHGDITSRMDELKENPSFMFLDEKQVGYLESYFKKLNRHHLIYPLIDFGQGFDKADVNSHWDGEQFRLQLEDHEGNCQTCWKKSDKKLFLIAKENPERFDAFKWFEDQYSQVKPNDDGQPRVFFRKNRDGSTILSQAGGIQVSTLRMLVYGGGSAREDDVSGCTESCNGYGIEV